MRAAKVFSGLQACGQIRVHKSGQLCRCWCSFDLPCPPDNGQHAPTVAAFQHRRLLRSMALCYERHVLGLQELPFIMTILDYIDSLGAWQLRPRQC